MEKDKRFMEASKWERLTEEEPGSCSDGQGHAQEIFDAVFFEGWSCVPSLLFTWGPSACNAGDPGSIPGLGRSPGEGNGNPLQ